MFKFIKILLVLILSLFSLSAFAMDNITKNTESYFSGFYSGLGLGISDLTPGLKSNNNTTVWADTSKTTKLVELQRDYENDKSIKGFNGQILAGFGKTLKSNFYIGCELFGNYFSGKKDESYNYKPTIIKQGDGATNDSSGHIKISNPISFGAAIRLGYLLSPRTMFYALIGFDYAKFDIENTMSDHYVDNSIDENFTITDKFNKWLPGFMPGFGIEAGISDHLSLRVQGTYALYKNYEHNVSKIDNAHKKNPPDRLYPYEINMHTKFNPDKITVQLMISYLFN